MPNYAQTFKLLCKNHEEWLKLIIGQCFQINIDVTHLDITKSKSNEESSKILKCIKILKQYSIGSVIHMGDGIVNPEQLKLLNLEIQNYCRIKSLITTDNEGGNIYRTAHSKGFNRDVGALTAKQMGDEGPEFCYNEASKLAYEMKNLYFNAVNAPCVDLDLGSPIISRYLRSFGKDSEHVIACAEMAINGFLEYGILPCIKHFPGHGSSTVDTHLDLADVTKNHSYKELDVFFRLMEETPVKMVMLAHVFHKELDPNLPVSVSPTVMAKLELSNPQVLKVMDDCYMKGLSNLYRTEDDQFDVKAVIKEFFNAGGDMLIAANAKLAKQAGHEPIEILNMTYEMVESGEISIDPFIKAFNRIYEVKLLSNQL